jgi:hypothetical protein
MTDEKSVRIPPPLDESLRVDVAAFKRDTALGLGSVLGMFDKRSRLLKDLDSKLETCNRSLTHARSLAEECPGRFDEHFSHRHEANLAEVDEWGRFRGELNLAYKKCQTSFQEADHALQEWLDAKPDAETSRGSAKIRDLATRLTRGMQICNVACERLMGTEISIRPPSVPASLHSSHSSGKDRSSSTEGVVDLDMSAPARPYERNAPERALEDAILELRATLELEQFSERHRRNDQTSRAPTLQSRADVSRKTDSTRHAGPSVTDKPAPGGGDRRRGR